MAPVNTASPGASTDDEDPLEKRYLFKLGTNFARIPFGLVTQAIIPRVLGPAHYGDFNFLSSVFNSFIALLNTGTGTAFYTKLSQRQEDRRLITFYWGVVAVASLALVVVVATIMGLGLEETVWPDQVVAFIWMGAIWGLLTWYGQVALKIVDAYALTVQGEIVRIIEGAVGTAAIVLIFWRFERISLGGFFVFRYATLLLLCFGFWYVLRRHSLHLLPPDGINRAQITQYSAEFWDYSSPLIVYTGVGFLATFADRWLLQNFGGSVEQGFFSLSQKVGAFCLMFTSAMTPLLLREFARASADRDRDGMARLFVRYIPILYALAVFVSVFACAQAEKVTWLFGGAEYENAVFAVALMSLYPIHQTYGQLSGSVFYATGQTRLYRNIGVVFTLLGLAVTYALIAPREWGGLNLSANGLAIKMLSVQLVAVNAQLWFNARFLRLSFAKLLKAQALTVIVFASLAWVFSRGTDVFVAPFLPSLIVSGVAYTAACVAIVWWIPQAIGIDRVQLAEFRRILRSILD